MIYKNTLKILLSNFDIVWKTILYYLLVGLITVGLGYLCINPIYILLKNSGFVDSVISIYSDFITHLNLTELFLNINELIIRLASILKHNLSRVWINFAGLGFVVLFVKSYLSNLTTLASANSLHYYMGSMNKHGFYLSFSETLAKNLKAQLVFFLINLPVKIIYFVLFVLCLQMFKISFAMSLLAIVIILVGFVLLFAFKYTLFASFIPTIIVLDFGIFKALKTSVKNTFRIFPKIFSGAILVVITIAISNFVIGICTFMVGLILTIPMSYLLYATFGMVTVYESQGMRYYVDVYNVITPKKKENSDKLKSMKYIV